LGTHKNEEVSSAEGGKVGVVMTEFLISLWSSSKAKRLIAINSSSPMSDAYHLTGNYQVIGYDRLADDVRYGFHQAS
jgi:hypothetical protein